MKQVSVEIIQKCPNNCMHCSSFSGMGCTMQISLEKMKEIIQSIANLKTEILSISGGEPFLHKDILDIVYAAKSNGLKVYIYTSGICIKDGVVDELDYNVLCELKRLDIDKIIFDLPAIDEKIYNYFMGTTGYLKHVLKSIEKTKKLNIFTEIHFVPTKVNLNQIEKVVDFANQLQIDKISFLGLVPHGRAKDNIDQLYLDESKNILLKEKLNLLSSKNNIRVGIPLQLQNSEYACYAGREKLCIRYDGNVYGCEAFKYIELRDERNRLIKPDSIYEKKVENIYYNSRYLIKERDFIAKQLKAMGGCEKCPVQYAIRKKAI